MGLIVQKFGGTSVGSTAKIKKAAERVIDEFNNGNKVAVVVSAMGKTTDELVAMAAELTDEPSKRELDMLLTTGEQVTISLLAMAIQAKGYEAVSFTGWQAGILTESVHGNARILDINPKAIQKELDSGKIVIAAGFQGADESGSITTLGRGGSDTTAVALAAALNADRCDIYTDVTGVYTTDPRYVKKARKLQAVSYDEMLELANLGAGVLHPRAVEYAKNYQIPLEVRSSSEYEKGTLIEEAAVMEQNLVVKGIAFEDQITRVTLYGLPGSMGTLSSVFTTLAKNHINVDIIIQSITDGDNNLSFSVKSEDVKQMLAVLEANQNKIGYTKVETESGLAKVSIVGSGMISNPGVAAEMFEVLAQSGIQIKMVSTSEIKVSAVISEKEMVQAVESLHEAFKLDERKPVQAK